VLWWHFGVHRHRYGLGGNGWYPHSPKIVSSVLCKSQELWWRKVGARPHKPPVASPPLCTWEKQVSQLPTIIRKKYYIVQKRRADTDWSRTVTSHAIEPNWTDLLSTYIQSDPKKFSTQCAQLDEVLQSTSYTGRLPVSYSVFVCVFWLCWPFDRLRFWSNFFRVVRNVES